ncbi:hypothetical protein T06_12116 [Trichinella sp. T6]|nr:hypothetical protein T06_12116 [Trichinella sp. T6]
MRKCWSSNQTLSNYNNEASLNAVHDKTVLFGGLVSQLKIPKIQFITCRYKMIVSRILSLLLFMKISVILRIAEILESHKTSCLFRAVLLECQFYRSEMKKFHFFANCIGPDESLHW